MSVNPPGTHKGRGVPDVAGDGDPNSGYQVRVDGDEFVIGGTSAVAPLWAGLIALMNQHSVARLGSSIHCSTALWWTRGLSRTSSRATTALIPRRQAGTHARAGGAPTVPDSSKNLEVETHRS